MKRAILRFVRLCGGRSIVKRINRGVRHLSAFTHRVQFLIEWGMAPTPEWFDHFIDTHYSWFQLRAPIMWERGVFNLLAIKQGASVLELCCGDGFNAHHFYSGRAGSVLSVDCDREAIHHARTNFTAPNVRYEVADIRRDLPSGPFDNVVWDAAIEHFTPVEMEAILRAITSRLTPTGILSGHTIVERAEKSHSEHEYEFKSKEDLTRVLTPHFRHVRVVETIYPMRHNLYFFAGNAELPCETSL